MTIRTRRLRAATLATALTGLLMLALGLVLPAQTPITLTGHVDRPGTRTDPLFYGLMTEEINFSYDGGLYAELIRNRAIGPGRRPLFYWTHVARGESVVDVAV